MDVHLIPVLNDNYAYLLQAADGTTAIVDPGESGPVQDVIEQKGGRLDFIMLTHHHGDHTGGAQALKQAYQATVTAPAAEAARIGDDLVDIGLSEKGSFAFGQENVSVIETPGHTLGHISYWFPRSHKLFAGDTLFAMGCGRVFEGTFDQMWQSLSKLKAIREDDTQIYCGHEYTLANAEFCLGLEPDNADLQSRYKKVQEMRQNGEPTLPTTLAQEKATNTFLRADMPEVQANLGMQGASPSAVFAEIRQRKDRA